LAAIAVLVSIAKLASMRQEKQLERLFQDERYQRALKLIENRTKTSFGDDEIVDEQSRFETGFEEAVQYLNGEGVPFDQAQKNLLAMIEVTGPSSQHVTA